jgi:predicted aspartyl protease
VTFSETKSEGVVGIDPMGRVAVTARIENVGHHAMVERGLMSASEVPVIEIGDALVDTDILTISLPRRFIRELDLMPFGTTTEPTNAGIVSHQRYGTVRLTVHGRECTSDVVEVPDDHPVLIGRIPLQLLDFVIDPSGSCLIGNPAHGGEHVIEMYQMSLL